MRKRKSFLSRVKAGHYRLPKKMLADGLLKALRRTSKKRKIR